MIKGALFTIYEIARDFGTDPATVYAYIKINHIKALKEEKGEKKYALAQFAELGNRLNSPKYKTDSKYIKKILSDDFGYEYVKNLLYLLHGDKSNANTKECSYYKDAHNLPQDKTDKDDSILTLKQQLKDQKEHYEQVIESKDETISLLKELIVTSQKLYNLGVFSTDELKGYLKSNK